MKIKPLYMYGTVFVIIIAIIVFTSSSNNEEMSKLSSPNSEMGMPNDSIHSGIKGMTKDSPNKTNVREDFWSKLEESKAKFEANPNDTTAMKKYALLLGMSHQTEKALELYEKILSINPNRVDILLAEGLAYFNDQNFAMAETVTKKIISIDVNNLEAKYNLGVIFVTKGDRDGAKKIWEELSEKHPDHNIGKLAASSLVKLIK